MEAKASATFVRIAPRKVQIVLDLIRGEDAEKAMAILKHTPKAACEVLEKVLETLRCRMLRKPGSDPQAYPSESTGQSLHHP